MHLNRSISWRVSGTERYPMRDRNKRAYTQLWESKRIRGELCWWNCQTMKKSRRSEISLLEIWSIFHSDFPTFIYECMYVHSLAAFKHCMHIEPYKFPLHWINRVSTIALFSFASDWIVYKRRVDKPIQIRDENNALVERLSPDTCAGEGNWYKPRRIAERSWNRSIDRSGWSVSRDVRLTAESAWLTGS